MQAFTNCVYMHSTNANTFSLIVRISQILDGSLHMGYFKVIADDTLALDAIAMSAFARSLLNVDNDMHVMVESSTAVHKLQQLTCEVWFLTNNKYAKKIAIDEAVFTDLIKVTLKDIPIMVNMVYVVVFENNNYAIRTNDIFTETGLITIDTEIELSVEAKSNNVIINKNSENVFKGNFDPSKLNIGGHTHILNSMFKKVFVTRLIPASIQKELGIQHVRGIIMHGPPGCGKTLIARELCKIFNCTPTIVSGPELLNSLVGQSEENVRKLFEPAKQNPNQMCVVILDECDVIFKKRGSGLGAGNQVSENITTQFLSMIDGPNSLNNILLIGMTNRLDAIDEAILRPGRLEMHLFIGLPDAKGREEVFSVHLNKIGASRKDADINIQRLSELSENFTGAEIEAVVGYAKTRAISRHVKPENVKSANYKDIVITQNDLESSTFEIKPKFGVDSGEFQVVASRPLHHKLPSSALEMLCNAKKGVVNVFIINDRHPDKACHLAKETEPTFIRFVTSETVMKSANGYSCSTFVELLQDVERVHSGTIVMHSIEKIIQYNPLVNNCNNNILQYVLALPEKILKCDQKLSIIITTMNLNLVKMLFESIEYNIIDV